jgi:hypothetical protein
MITRRTILFRVLTRKMVTLLLVGTAIAAFATLGDGKSKGKKRSVLNNKTMITPGKFSLKSGYQYRGSQVINQQKSNELITLNSIVTYQNGHATYIMPLKTTVHTQKLKFSVGIPQLGKN